jgi:hypothetical protein
MENQEKKQILIAIYEYLTLMPNAAYYNVCRQQETLKVLELLLSKKDGMYGKLLNVELLESHLGHVKKWDGVKHEPQDASFQLLLLDVQLALKLIRGKLLEETSEKEAKGS